MADGGEGTVHALVRACDGDLKEASVRGPLGDTVKASYGLIQNGRTAVIEMSAASGLPLVAPTQRRPLDATTWGTGELIKAALDDGVQRIIMGIGGSATNDGGAGMLQALGYKLLDYNGQQIGDGGGQLHQLYKIDTSECDTRLSEVKIEVACDVDNPLIGPRGASYVYGPQKGASEDMVKILDHNLAHYGQTIKDQLGIDVLNMKGAGAAGGIGAALVAFLGAELRSGIDLMVSITRLESYVKDASLVITGEGRIDQQSLHGKVPVGVAQLAQRHGVPVICIAGTIQTEGNDNHFAQYGMDKLFSIVPGVISIDEAMANAQQYVYQTSRRIASALKLGQSLINE